MRLRPGLFVSCGLLVILVAVGVAQDAAPVYVFTTFAGKAGEAGSVDGKGTEARFRYPAKIAIDAGGNAFVVDKGNGAIRKIAPDGTVTTLAKGFYDTFVPFTTDAIYTGFGGITGVAVGGDGNLFITDTEGSLFTIFGAQQLTTPLGSSKAYVQEITPSGETSIVAGGADYRYTSVFSSSPPTLTRTGPYDGTGAGAAFEFPLGIAFDGDGNAFVIDGPILSLSGCNIRKITPAGVVTTFIGQPPSSGLISATPIPIGPSSDLQRDVDGNVLAARFGSATDIAALPSGGFAVSESATIRRVSPTGDVVTVAGQSGASDNVDGVGRDARFGLISAIAVDRSGNVWVADSRSHTLRRMTPDLVVTTIAGLAQSSGSADGVGKDARFLAPAGIAVDAAGTIYVADNGNHTIRKGVLAVAPKIQTQPQSYSIEPGYSVALAVSATGVPAPTFQWGKDGAAIPGATSSSLTLGNPQIGDGGRYTVTVANAVGSVTSNAATLTVGVTPVISSQPLTQTVLGGQNATLSVAATGAPAPIFQWRKDGADIAGATNSTLTLSSAQAGDAGSYSVVVTNAAGSVTSSAAVLTVNTSRIVNLSIRSNLAAGGSLTVGFVVAGNGKPLLVRGVGPGLAQFGLNGTLADPRLGFYSGSTLVTSNDNWGSAANAAQIAATAAQVGAFALPAGSLDAALLTTLDGGGYSVQVTGAASTGADGITLVELYDANNTTAARLANVSARAQVGTGEGALFAGFVVSGNAKRTVLIRAIGPTLASFGVTGALADPRLDLLAGGATTAFATSDNWGGDPALAAAFGAVGAFPLAASSKDAALLATLDPGSYSVQVSGVGGTTGEALVEIYEVP